MTLYWVLFSYFALGTLTTAQKPARAPLSPLFLFGILLVVLAIGFRFEVGADWTSYRYLFRYAAYVDLDRAIATGDPGYQLVNWLVAQIGGSIVAVNLICAAIFGWGLDRFARSQPYPWLTVLVAVPYLIVVVAMGYTRQATAIGILMAGMASLVRGGGIVRFTAYVVIAALFHRTAVVMLPFAIFALQRNRVINVAVGVVATLLLYQYFLADALEVFVRNYLNTSYSSQGALIRVSMSLVPAIVFFVARGRLGFVDREYRLWWILSATSVAMLVLLFALSSSTAVDRLALYLIPLQLVVIPRAITLFRDRRIGTLVVLSYAFAVLFVWLNYAEHARFWVPYHLSFWR